MPWISGLRLTMMMTEIKIAPQESAAAGDRISGKHQEKLAARSVVILLNVSAQTCFEKAEVFGVR